MKYPCKARTTLIQINKPLGYSGNEIDLGIARSFAFEHEIRSVESAATRSAHMGYDYPIEAIVGVQRGRTDGIDDDLFSRSLFIGNCRNSGAARRQAGGSRCRRPLGAGEFKRSSPPSPTPGSIATAERALGELSSEKGVIIRGAMTRAREADRIGDREACLRALDEVRQTIAP
jgi:hypothetical protein